MMEKLGKRYLWKISLLLGLFVVLALASNGWGRNSKNGWYYSPEENGRGVSIEIQGEFLFLAMYAYDQSQPTRPIWYTAGNIMSDTNSFSGELWQWTGWPLGSDYVAPTHQTVGIWPNWEAWILLFPARTQRS